jgi:hypothetical protein
MMMMMMTVMMILVRGMRMVICHNITLISVSVLFRLLQAGRSRVQFPMVSLEFFIDIILPTAL